MDTFLQSVYVGEIKTQCQFALNAVGNLNYVLQQLDGEQEEAGQCEFFRQEVFRHIHSFLTHASNVSRLFWPPVPAQRRNEPHADYEVRIGVLDKVQRANTLRQLYHIEETSCLRNRTLRDHLEHYDERLDDWRRTSTSHNMVSDNIGSSNIIAGFAETDMMRWFDPSTNQFRFRGEAYALQSLVSEIARLLPLSE